MATPILGPVPPFSNPTIQPQYYSPSQFFISAITLGQKTTVTTSVAHNYVIGQQVRLLIPRAYGCRQLNESFGIVLSIPMSTQVIVSINSSINVDPFIASSAPGQKAQIMAIGDVNTGVINSNGISSQGTFIPGSFTDISPL